MADYVEIEAELKNIEALFIPIMMRLYQAGCNLFEMPGGG
jgi:hypothetical protein